MIEQANPASVRRYLEAAYLVQPELLDRIMSTPPAVAAIRRASRRGDFAYVPGDEIAEHFGLVENPDYDENESEDTKPEPVHVPREIAQRLVQEMRHRAKTPASLHDPGTSTAQLLETAATLIEILMAQLES